MSATDPRCPKQDWVMHQYKIKGFGDMPHDGQGYDIGAKVVRYVSILGLDCMRLYQH